MKKVVSLALVMTVATASVLWVAVPSAQAIPPFKKEFEAKYLKKDSSDPKDVALVEAVAKVKCNVCHKGKDKKMRNAYGDALAELLDKKADAKNPEKIQEALDKVAGMHSVSGDSASPTFGDLLKEGKLPSNDTE